MWNQRLKQHPIPQIKPQLGSVDPTTHTVPVQTIPVNDKGVMLTCNSKITAAAEIEEWERAIDIAVGKYYNVWDDARYEVIESTLAGRAKLMWDSYKATTEYQATFVREFQQAPAKGTRMGQMMRLFFCGTTSPTEEARKRQDQARLAMQKLVCCDIAAIDLYNETFMQLHLLMGDFNSLANRRAYFAKLPEPWNHEMTKKYVEPEVNDSVGARMRFVKDEIEGFCTQERLRKASKSNYSNLCGSLIEPYLKIGCEKESRETFMRTRLGLSGCMQMNVRDRG